MKACSRCRVEKEPAEFSLKGQFSYCKACVREYDRDRRMTETGKEYNRKHQSRYRHNNRSVYRNMEVKKLYGADAPWLVMELERKQQGLCAVCKSPPGVRSLHVDHDHVTGKIRSLLCQGCNTAEGQLKGNPVTMRALADYVTEHDPIKTSPDLFLVLL